MIKHTADTRKTLQLALIELAATVGRIDACAAESMETQDEINLMNDQLNRAIDLASRARYRLGLLQDQITTKGA